MFQGKYVNRVHSSERWTDDEDRNEQVVERQGFIPLKKRVESFLSSGEKLAQFRREAYDYEASEMVDDEEAEREFDSYSGIYDHEDISTLAASARAVEARMREAMAKKAKEAGTVDKPPKLSTVQAQEKAGTVDNSGELSTAKANKAE